MKRSPRTPAKLLHSTHQRLNMYALAASAAGMGVLAFAQPAQAKIVYTKAHQVLPFGQEIFLDVNHDGINDFGLLATYSFFGHAARSALNLDARNNSFILGTITKQHVFCAADLPKGVKVGLKAQFHSGVGAMYEHYATTNTSGHSCAWNWGKTGYLGLKFAIRGKTHFGWARVQSMKNGGSILLGYAYETVPNRPIVTGKTHGPDEVGPDATTVVTRSLTLGTLATGAPGLSTWSRKELPRAAEGN